MYIVRMGAVTCILALMIINTTSDVVCKVCCIALANNAVLMSVVCGTY